MEITEVRVFPVNESRLRAFASIVIDDAFVVSDIRIIDGPSGRFLSMPSARRKNGTYRDIAHPLNAETRHMLEERILGRYEQMLAEERQEGGHGRTRHGARDAGDGRLPASASPEDGGNIAHAARGRAAFR